MSSPSWFKRVWVRLIWALTPSCVEMTKLASTELDHSSPWFVRLRIRLHFVICVWCRRYFKQLNHLREQSLEASHRIPESKEPKLSDDVKNRMKRLLEESQRRK